MDKKFIVKTSKSSFNNVVTLGVIIMLLSCFILGIVSYELIKNDGEPTKDSIYIAFFIFFEGLFGRYLIWVINRIKKDFILVDSKGITIDVHGNEFFPKKIQCHYNWDELSSYSLDGSVVNGEYCDFVQNCVLKLYDTHGQLLKKIKFHEFFGEDIFLLNEHMGSHGIMNREKQDAEEELS